MNPSSATDRTSPRYGAMAPLRNLALFLALAVATPAAAEIRILAFGDSLTQGFGLPEDQGFVPTLEAWLHANGAPDVTVVNAGVSGDTSEGGLARIEWSLTPDIDGVIVELGANDLLRGIDVRITQKNLDGILAIIDAHNLPAILAGIPAPPNFGEERARAFKGMYREVAEKYGAIYYGSFFAGMGQGRNMFQVMRLMQSDGEHPNAKGVEAIVDHIGPVVLELVAEARSRS
jgi:acyl-CoA thioesterase-1